MSAERMRLVGRGLDAPTLAPWLDRHATRLGLALTPACTSPAAVEIDLRGPEPLRDMMAVACLLGPIEVWVDAVERRALDPSAADF